MTYHRSGAWGCNGQDLKAVLDEAVAFIQSQPTEFALLKFSHIRDYKDHNPEDIKAKVNPFLREPAYQPYLYTHTNPNLALSETAVGNFRGKLVVLYDYDQGVSHSTGRFL